MCLAPIAPPAPVQTALASPRGQPAGVIYFHNGSAKDLDEVVRFYNDRFGIGFTALGAGLRTALRGAGWSTSRWERDTRSPASRT